MKVIKLIQSNSILKWSLNKDFKFSEQLIRKSIQLKETLLKRDPFVIYVFKLKWKNNETKANKML